MCEYNLVESFALYHSCDILSRFQCHIQALGKACEGLSWWSLPNLRHTQLVSQVQADSTLQQVLGGHPMVLTSPKYWGVYKWPVSLPVAFRGLSSRTLTLSHSARPPFLSMSPLPESLQQLSLYLGQWTFLRVCSPTTRYQDSVALHEHFMPLKPIPVSDPYTININ